jgi:hypothetical protein
MIGTAAAERCSRDGWRSGFWSPAVKRRDNEIAFFANNVSRGIFVTPDAAESDRPDLAAVEAEAMAVVATLDNHSPSSFARRQAHREFFDHFAGNDRDAGKLSPGDVGQRPSCSALGRESGNLQKLLCSRFRKLTIASSDVYLAYMLRGKQRRRRKPPNGSNLRMTPTPRTSWEPT